MKDKNKTKDKLMWEATFNSITELISIHDKDFNIVRVNNAFSDALKKKSDELIGKKCYEVIHGTKEPWPQCPHKRTLEIEEPCTEEFFEPTLESYLQVSTSPIFDENGEIIGTVHIAKDITERKKEEIESRLQSKIIANTFEGVNLVKADDGVIIYTNPKFEEMFGYSHDELIGKHISIVNAPTEKSPQQTANEIMGYLNTNGIWQGEIYNIKKDGTPFWCYASVSMFNHDYYGKVFLSVQTDITERKRTENRINRINRLKEDLLGPCSLDKKLKRITDGVGEIFDADFARIWVTKPGDLCDSGCFHARVTEGPHICRERDQCLNLIASSGRYTHTDGEVHRRVPFGCYKIGRIAAGETPKFVTNDVTHDSHVHDHNWAKKLGLVSFAGYRLLSEDRNPIGVLALFCKHAISPDEDALLDGIAGTTAQVIQTAKAEEALKTARDELEIRVHERTAELESAAELLKEEITERRNMENELLFKTALLQAQSESSIDGILVVDNDGKVISYPSSTVEG